MKIIVVIAAVVLWSTAVGCSQHQHRVGASFSEQVARLLDAIKMPERELALVPKILQDLERVFNIRWPERQVFQFGSLVNGLALEGSDVDVTVLLNGTDDEGTVIAKVAQVLQRYPHLFTDIKVFDFFGTFSESVKLMSVKHIPTEFDVDLIFNNMEGVRNTELTSYLIHLDDRMFDLVMIVKYWAKVHKLTTGTDLSNYAVTLLVIFYLQQRHIVPPIVSLQCGAEPCFLKGWDTGFNQIKYEPCIKYSLYELLGGFFEYYNTFNYRKNIISTFTGRPIERKLFEDLRNVPKEYSLYKKNVEKGVSKALVLRHTPIILQDPFTHSINLVKNLKWRTFAELMAQIRSGARKYRGNSEKDFLNLILTNS